MLAAFAGRLPLVHVGATGTAGRSSHNRTFWSLKLPNDIDELVR